MPTATTCSRADEPSHSRCLYVRVSLVACASTQLAHLFLYCKGRVEPNLEPLLSQLSHIKFEAK